MNIIPESDLSSILNHLNGWTYDGKKIYRKFSFKDFRQAFSFLSFVALLAERMDHHPELFNSYNKVELWLTTHDLGGVSDLDIEFARELNDFT